MGTREEVIQWKADALEDGWLSKSRPVDIWCKLFKDGFLVMIVLRDGEEDLHIWGPDGLAIEETFPYSWKQLQKGLEICSMCGKVGPTVKLAFANRVCQECRTENVAEHERPGWCD